MVKGEGSNPDEEEEKGSDPEKDRPTLSELSPSSSSPMGLAGAGSLGSAGSHGARRGGSDRRREGARTGGGGSELARRLVSRCGGEGVSGRVGLRMKRRGTGADEDDSVESLCVQVCPDGTERMESSACSAGGKRS